MDIIEKANATNRTPATGEPQKLEYDNQLGSLCSDAIAIIEAARQTAYKAVNTAMVYSYFELGRRIV